MSFFLELLINGLLTGTLYALVALGLVLIYKASGVLNFAQGAMVLMAGFLVALLINFGVPAILAILGGAVAMIAMSFNLVQEQVINSVKTLGKQLGILKDDDDDDDY